MGYISTLTHCYSKSLERCMEIRFGRTQVLDVLTLQPFQLQNTGAKKSYPHVNVTRPDCPLTYEQQPLSFMASLSRVGRRRGIFAMRLIHSPEAALYPLWPPYEVWMWRSQYAWEFTQLRVSEVAKDKKTLDRLVFVCFSSMFCSAFTQAADVSTSADRSDRPRNDISIMTWKLFWLRLFPKYACDGAVLSLHLHFERPCHWDMI